MVSPPGRGNSTCKGSLAVLACHSIRQSVACLGNLQEVQWAGKQKPVTHEVKLENEKIQSWEVGRKGERETLF